MSVDFQNFGVSDPFANDTAESGGANGASTHLIRKLCCRLCCSLCTVRMFMAAAATSCFFSDIRNQQRNGRKSVTTVQGLPKGFDLKKMVRALKKEFSCNGTLIDDPEYGHIIQLQGDQRQAVKEFLEREAICGSDQIRIHGV